MRHCIVLEGIIPGEMEEKVLEQISHPRHVENWAQNMSILKGKLKEDNTSRKTERLEEED